MFDSTAIDTHEWRTIGGVVVSFTGPGSVSDALWAKYVEALRADGVRMALAITSDDSSAINATQRKAASDALQERGVAAIAVTNSRLVRGVLTAASWLGVKVKGFSWDQLDDAIASASTERMVQQEIRELAETYRQRWASRAG